MNVETFQIAGMFTVLILITVLVFRIYRKPDLLRCGKHLYCDCGQEVRLKEGHNICSNCGSVYKMTIRPVTLKDGETYQHIVVHKVSK